VSDFQCKYATKYGSSQEDKVHLHDHVLDKGTSALDPKNEVTILDAVQIPGARPLLLNSQVTCDADE
jgi:hypothetical protein